MRAESKYSHTIKALLYHEYKKQLAYEISKAYIPTQKNNHFVTFCSKTVHNNRSHS